MIFSIPPSRNRISIYLSFAFMFLCFSSNAQEQMGLRLERWSGIYSATLNPANTAFNPLPWEVSLFNADLYADNNYAFIRDAGLPEVLRDQDRLFSISDTSAERPIPPDALVLDFYESSRPFYGVVQTRVGGPGFSFRIGEQHVVGLQTGVRANVSSYRLPSVFQYSTFSELPVNVPQEIDPVLVAGMAWGEIGLHYSYRSWGNDQGVFSFGVTPKLLLGLDGFYSRAGAQFDYTPGQADTASFARAQWNYGLTLQNTRIDSTDELKARVSGYGAGIDLGFAWTIPADDAETDEDYFMRLGASVLDLGAVGFNKDAQAHRLNFDSTTVLAPDAFDGADSAEEYIQDLSAALAGDSLASLQASRFSIGLPTALSFQFDLRPVKNVYVSAVLVQRIPLWKYTVKRPNMLAVVPRYEHKWFSASLPVVWDDYRKLRVGFAARLAYLTIGSDNLASWFGQKELSGTDIYIGLKVNGFTLSGGNGKRGTSKRGGRSKRSWRKIKCYEF